MSQSPSAALAYLSENQARFIDELKAFLRIPSISGDPAYRGEMRQAAEWAAGRLQAAGLEQVEIFPTPGHPMVVGQFLSAGPQAPTILVYGHYDVQPPDPLEDWRSEPFEPVVKGENLYARGATDMKGQVMATVAAVEAVLRSGDRPANIKFLLEGEEEIGSANMAQFLSDQHDRLAADFVLNPDAGMPAAGIPAIVYSLRGGLGYRLHVYGPAQDLHSGLFGGVVHNPIHALCELIAGLHDEHGRITLPGFYDRVRDLDDEEREELARLPMDEAYYLERSGAPALWGDSSHMPIERTGTQPSFDVSKIEAGQPKSAIPAKATARLGFRLVADQDPGEIDRLFRLYLEKQAPATVRWELERVGASGAVLTDRHSPGVRAMRRALNTVWGVQPVFYPVGGGIPVALMCQQILGIDSVLTGFALPEDNLHGPNEKLHLPTWTKGTQALVHFFYNLA